MHIHHPFFRIERHLGEDQVLSNTLVIVTLHVALHKHSQWHVGKR